MRHDVGKKGEVQVRAIEEGETLLRYTFHYNERMNIDIINQRLDRATQHGAAGHETPHGRQT